MKAYFFAKFREQSEAKVNDNFGKYHLIIQQTWYNGSKYRIKFLSFESLVLYLVLIKTIQFSIFHKNVITHFLYQAPYHSTFLNKDNK